MTNTTPFKLVDDETQAWRKDAADYLRVLAKRVENGEIKQVVTVCNDREAACFERFGHFENRWEILGALEYAKSAVYDAE